MTDDDHEHSSYSDPSPSPSSTTVNDEEAAEADEGEFMIPSPSASAIATTSETTTTSSSYNNNHNHNHNSSMNSCNYNNSSNSCNYNNSSNSCNYNNSATSNDICNNFNNSTSTRGSLCNFNNSTSSCNFDNSAATLPTCNRNRNSNNRNNQEIVEDDDDNTIAITNASESAPSIAPTTAPTTATDTATASSDTNSDNGDTNMDIKQRSRSNNTNNDHPQVGAVHVDERAPHINRRFFQGLTRPGQRLRAREERAAGRRARQNQNQDNATTNAAATLAVIEDAEPSDGSDGGGDGGTINNNNSNNLNISSHNRRSLFSRAHSRPNMNSNSNTNINNPDDTNDTNNNDSDTLGLVSATLVEEQDIFMAQVINVEDELYPIPDSDVERIVQRLELRNANRVPVPLEVKSRFLKLCNDACRRNRDIRENRERLLLDLEHGVSDGDDDGDDDDNSIDGHSLKSEKSNNNNLSISKTWNRNASNNPTINNIAQCCIQRQDVINLRNSIRLEVENRSRITQITDGIKKYFGFRCHAKVLLHVLNRAVDLIDERKRGPLLSKRGNRNSGNSGNRNIGNNRGNGSGNDDIRRGSVGGIGAFALGSSLNSATVVGSTYSMSTGISNASLDQATSMEEGINNDHNNSNNNNNNLEQKEEDDDEWFYYKDFSFYNLKIESNYPWMRGAGVFSILVTFAFLLFTPILWCGILQDENICPSDGSSYNGWLTSLYFASVTMSTVGYGDTTVFVGSSSTNNDGNPLPETWRIFIAILFMIFSLIVSVVGFQAGLETQFHPFRERLDLFGRRVYEILREANIVKGAQDKHEDVVSRMRFAKFSQLFEIFTSFVILNLTGMLALQLSLFLSENSNEDGVEEKLYISWMESLYWAVQTTTTIGYGDVDIPDNLRWFLLLFLSISTYFVGSSFGKLSDLSAKLESMQRLYLWQQQEASYTMLADFSGRPDHRDGDGREGNNDDVEAQEILELEPEINQFEFTIASLVLLGKITSNDVRPILEKFKKLTGDNNVITAADVSGPIRKNEESTEDEDEDEAQSDEESSCDGNEDSQDKASGSSALAVGKKIAQAFREELLSSGAVNETKENDTEEDSALEYSKFRLPTNTFAIAIDDSKIQRKLLGKLLGFAGIPIDRTTIVGDGYDEIMGFEDIVVNFMTHHSDDYVFLLVDENLDTIDEHSNHMTISGSLCVENIRKRLPYNLEKRMFALVRSANDSSSDIAIYSQRAHGFLPKAPIKRDKVCETLAPLWFGRFPPSEFGETICFSSKNETSPMGSEDVACTPHDISQKVTYIESLFESDVHVTDVHTIHEQIHELKGDILTLNSTVSVTSIIGHINLLLVAQASEIVLDRWHYVRDHVNDVINLLQENFRIPPNTYAIAIDDSKIQRKLLSKFFQFMEIPPEKCTILGDGTDEIIGFEEFVVGFMSHHTDDYVFVIVDENLDIVDEHSNHITISGSLCVENIRKRLPYELERRLLAVVRSANDSTTDVANFNTRAHGVLPKAPIRREKVNETLAPLWFGRFPLSEFSDSVGFNELDESNSSIASEELACTPGDIAQTLAEIDSLFEQNIHVTNWRVIHDQLHMLKGDILTLTSDASMIISILGMINLMLLGHSQDPGAATEKEKWNGLKERIYNTIHTMHRKSQCGEKSAQKSIVSRLRLPRRSSTNSLKPLSSSFISTISLETDGSIRRSSTNTLKSLSGSIVSTVSSLEPASEADGSIPGDK